MTAIRAGILSDTHLRRPTELFYKQVSACFADIPIILHAGDLTDISILAAFDGKEVHAVHGNMCSRQARSLLPDKKIITLGSFKIALIHGMCVLPNPEDSLYDQFDNVDCIVSGHTHKPVCKTIGSVLFINPGSFAATSRYGAPGTYAILEIGEKLGGKIVEVPRL